MALQGMLCRIAQIRIRQDAHDCAFRAPYAERRALGDDHLAITAQKVAALLERLNPALPKDVPPLPVPLSSELERRVAISDIRAAG
jgi:hypothetical protein